MKMTHVMEFECLQRRYAPPLPFRSRPCRRCRLWHLLHYPSRTLRQHQARLVQGVPSRRKTRTSLPKLTSGAPKRLLCIFIKAHIDLFCISPPYVSPLSTRHPPRISFQDEPGVPHFDRPLHPASRGSRANERSSIYPAQVFDKPDSAGLPRQAR